MTADRTPLKLQGIADGDLYGLSYRTLYEETEPGRFRAGGRLPVPEGGRAGLSYRLQTTRPWKPVAERVVGRFPTCNVWRVDDEVLAGSAVRWLFASTDGGETWRTTERLPDSSGTMGVLPSAFCTRGNSVYVGEYPLDDEATPRVLRSDDGGRTWTTALSLPGVRHVHAIARDPYSGELWMTTGDAGGECRIGRLRDGEFDVAGAGGQRWRAVEPAFAPAGVLWGVDSVYTEENPIFLLPRDRIGRSDPRVERVGAVDSSVYYSASFAVGDEHWVAFSTAAESGVDSTAPADKRVVRSAGATVVAASSASGYERWHEVAAYDRRTAVSDVGPLADALPSANAYVFLAADDERGLFVNPWNTVRHDGVVRNFRPSFFERLA